MARHEGTLKLTSNIEPKMNAPLDARLVVQEKGDLYTLEHPYEGMIVSLKTGGAFQLVGPDQADEANWEPIMESSYELVTAIDVESWFN